MGKGGNWTHWHGVARERLVSRGFKERGNITATTWGAVRDTNEISRKEGRGKCERVKGTADEDSWQLRNKGDRKGGRCRLRMR